MTQSCFVERDPELPLARRALAEGIGTALLMFAAPALGLAAMALFAKTPGAALVSSAVGIATVLSGLIVALGEVSGGHFNPLITALQWLSGERSWACPSGYVAAQIMGAISGALTARVLYGTVVSAAPRPSWQLGISELIAAFGLMVVVFGCSRGNKPVIGPFAVGGWVAGAFIATSSRCYANPALSVGAVFAAGSVALRFDSAAEFVLAQAVGAIAASAVIAALYPQPANRTIGIGASA